MNEHIRYKQMEEILWEFNYEKLCNQRLFHDGDKLYELYDDEIAHELLLLERKISDIINKFDNSLLGCKYYFSEVGCLLEDMCGCKNIPDYEKNANLNYTLDGTKVLLRGISRELDIICDFLLNIEDYSPFFSYGIKEFEELSQYVVMVNIKLSELNKIFKSWLENI